VLVVELIKLFSVFVQVVLIDIVFVAVGIACTLFT